MSGKVAVVTGSNQGIGFAIVKELCKRGVEYVYLTARNVTRGQEAAEKLKQEGLNPIFHQLEVTDKESIKTLASHIKKEHGGVDILINNAGIGSNTTTYEEAAQIINVNYRSILLIQEYLFPILRDNARVINISSDCGHISNIRNPEWIKRLTKEDIQVDDINVFVDWFLDSVKNGKLNLKDFAESSILAYRVSKVALCALTRIQQKQVGRGISINSLHPGFVQTNMTGGHGFLTLDESSKAPAYLALDVAQSVKGKYFWFDKTEKDWADPKLELYCKFEESMNQVGAAITK